MAVKLTSPLVKVLLTKATPRRRKTTRLLAKENLAALSYLKAYFLLVGFVGFLGFGKVSTTVVFGRRFASLTGMNSPVLASLPILRSLAMDILHTKPGGCAAHTGTHRAPRRFSGARIRISDRGQESSIPIARCRVLLLTF